MSKLIKVVAVRSVLMPNGRTYAKGQPINVTPDEGAAMVKQGGWRAASKADLAAWGNRAKSTLSRDNAAIRPPQAKVLPDSAPDAEAMARLQEQLEGQSDALADAMEFRAVIEEKHPDLAKQVAAELADAAAKAKAEEAAAKKADAKSGKADDQKDLIG